MAVKNIFKKQKYQVVKGIISKDICNFVYKYLIVQAAAVKDLYDKRIASPGLFTGIFTDSQVQGVYSKHGDWAMDTLLAMTITPIKKYTGLDLIPTYSYTRLYTNGSTLARHKDRPSCEISVTLNLGGEQWDFYLDSKDNKEIKVKLSPGDILIYSGCELKHWRKKFEGNICAQVFLHYNDINGPFKIENTYDKRQMLGVPN